MFVVQSRSIEASPDGTVRWLLVDVQPDITPGVINEFSLQRRAATQPSATAPLSVSESTGVIIVDTGTARFTMGAGESFSFRSVEAGGGAGIGEAGFTITDRGGRLHRAVIDRAETVESGPLRCVVSLAGHVHAGPSGRPLLVTANLHFFSGLATVRLLVTLTNPNRARHRGGFSNIGDEGSALIEDACDHHRACGERHPRRRAGVYRAWCAVDAGRDSFRGVSGLERRRGLAEHGPSES